MVSGPQSVGERRRAHEIAEEDSDLLALPFDGRPGLEDLLAEVGWGGVGWGVV